MNLIPIEAVDAVCDELGPWSEDRQERDGISYTWVSRDDVIRALTEALPEIRRAVLLDAADRLQAEFDAFHDETGEPHHTAGGSIRLRQMAEEAP